MSARERKPKRTDGRCDRPDWRERLAEGLGVPCDTLDGGDLAEVRGRRNLTVSGCRQILQYSPTRVTLEMKRYVLTVEGARLHCLTYCAGSVGIDGRIDRLLFDGGAEREEGES